MTWYYFKTVFITTNYSTAINRCLFWGLIVIAISLSGLRLSLWTANIYKANIEHYISQRLGQTVSLGKIKGTLQSGHPELILHDLNLYSTDSKESLLSLRKVYLRLNLLNVLQQSLFSGLQITLVGAKFSITRLKSGNISISGLPKNNKNNNRQPIWLMQGEHYRLIDSHITWHDQKRHAPPLLLEHVNISIHNQADKHKLSAETQLPKALGESLQLVMEFTGNIFKENDTDAKLFIQAKQINLEKLALGDLPFKLQITQGYSDFSLWSTWQASQMTRLQGHLQLHDSLLHYAKKDYTIKHLAFNLLLRKQAQKWQLAVNKLQLKTAQNTLALKQLNLASTHTSDKQLHTFSLYCPQLNLTSFSHLAHEWSLLNNTDYATLKAEGQLKQLSLFTNNTHKTIALSAQAEKISLHTEQHGSIKNLSFFIQGNTQGGEVVLQSKNSQLNLPTLFRKPISLAIFSGLINWQQNDEAWQINSPWLEIDTPDFKTHNKFDLTLPKHAKNPHIALHNYLYQVNDISVIPNYLPADIMPDFLTYWLDNAFISGQISHGSTLLRGELKQFPFIKQQGVFQVGLYGQNINLHYSPDWPNLNNLNAYIEFLSNSLHIDIHKSHTQYGDIKHAKIDIDSYRDSDYLNIQGRIDSHFSQGIEFLKNSILKKNITALTDIISLTGTLNLDIALGIPLKKVENKIAITLNTEQSKALLKAAKLPLDNIKGQLKISPQGIFSESLSAKTLGFPVKIQLKNQENITYAHISGRTDIAHLAKYFPHPLWKNMQGSSLYNITVHCPSDTRLNSQLHFNSTLEGIDIQLAPFSKLPDDKNPFAFTIELNNQGLNSLKLNYENPHSPSNRFDINLKKISPYWQGIFHSPFASGSVFIPEAFSAHTKISMNLSKLNISALKQIKFKPQAQATPFSIENLPQIHINSAQVLFNNMDFGKLSLHTKTSQQTVFINQLTLEHLQHRLNASGHWQHNAQKNQSTLNGSFQHQTFGNFLNQLDLSDSLAETHAQINFNLQSDHEIYALSPENVSGKINTQLKNGRILGIETGFGRILGLLDIFKLDQRLQLNFSDITKSGLSFSSLDADFNLKKGHIETQNLSIDAMPAKIKLSGHTQLQNQHLDFNATVLPKFPIAGTIIGKASNAISKAFSGNEHAGGLLLSLLYTIKGTWDNLEIKRHVYDTPATHEAPQNQP